MIEERGRVVDVNPEGIWVETTKTSACASCAAKSGCGQKLLVQAAGSKRFIFRVSNPSKLAVQVDDPVMVGVEEGALLKATLLTYMLPLLGLMAVAVLSHLLGLPESRIILFSLLGLACGLLSVRILSRWMFHTSEYHPVLTQVLTV